MTEYELGQAADELEEPAAAGEPVEEYADPYADPQEWISGLIAKLERAEQGIGSGPRDALMARIKLAQAYSELGDTVQAAPLAVANVAQAMALFPSSEGMLRQLREFRDAACEAAGWTAAMMREPDAEELAQDEPSELVARPDAGDAAAAGVAAAGVAAADAAAADDVAADDVAAAADSADDYAADDAEQTVAAPVNADPADDFSPAQEQIQIQIQIPVVPAAAADAAEDFAAEDFAPNHETPAPPHQPTEPEPAGAVIHEFVRRSPEPDALQWSAEVQAALTQPAELAIPAAPEPEYAEEVEPALASGDLAELSDLADLAALEEIIRLRYELREAQRTVERLRHVNRKLREALAFDDGQ